VRVQPGVRLPVSTAGQSAGDLDNGRREAPVGRGASLTVGGWQSPSPSGPPPAWPEPQNQPGGPGQRDPRQQDDPDRNQGLVVVVVVALAVGAVIVGAIALGLLAGLAAS
jgi:hypothetical protein